MSFRVQMLAISSAIFPCPLIMSGISLPVEQPALTHCHQRCPQSPPVLLPLDPTACLSSMAHGNAHLHIIISKWGCYGVISTEESHFFFLYSVSLQALHGRRYPVNTESCNPMALANVVQQGIKLQVTGRERLSKSFETEISRHEWIVLCQVLKGLVKLLR